MSKWFKSLGSLKARARNYCFPSATLFSPVPVKFATNLKILRISSVVVANFFTLYTDTLLANAKVQVHQINSGAVSQKICAGLRCLSQASGLILKKVKGFNRPCNLEKGKGQRKRTF